MTDPPSPLPLPADTCVALIRPLEGGSKEGTGRGHAMRACNASIPGLLKRSEAALVCEIPASQSGSVQTSQSKTVHENVTWCFTSMHGARRLRGRQAGKSTPHVRGSYPCNFRAGEGERESLRFYALCCACFRLTSSERVTSACLKERDKRSRDPGRMQVAAWQCTERRVLCWGRSASVLCRRQSA